MFRESKRYLKLAMVGTAFALFVQLLSWQSYFNEINEAAYDFTLRLAGEVEPSSPTVIVAIDEESLDRIGAWPWPRKILAQLIERVADHNPQVIGVDLVLDDSREQLSDFLLARSIGASGKVVLATRVDDSSGQSLWRYPLPIFSSTDVRLGHVHAEPDLDGVIRRVSSAKEAEGRIFSAFGVEVLRLASKLPPDFEQEIGSSVRIVPDPILIRFSGDRQTFKHIPAWEVLNGGASALALRGSIVLIGVTAEGLGDSWMTPFSAEGRRMSGVEVHANLVETIFSSMQVKPIPYMMVWLSLVLLVLVLWWIDYQYEGRWFYAVALAAPPLFVTISWSLMTSLSLWVPFPTFLLALTLLVPGLVVRKMVKVSRDLDEKIGKLSSWATEEPIPSNAGTDARSYLTERLEEGQEKERWLALLDTAEKEGWSRKNRRERLFGAKRQDSRWKLDAVDFFNDQLYRYLSFNNAILASIDDIIVVADPMGRIVYRNPSAERVVGKPSGPLHAWDYLSRLIDSENLFFEFAAVFSGNVPRRLESIQSIDGKHYYTVTLSPIAGIGILASVQDVTTQHELNQAKNDMLSLVSHELRTPLTSIQGYSDMLDKYQLVDEQGREFLECIGDETRRLDHLIQSFLDVAYIEAGKKVLNMTEFPIGPVLEDLVRSHEPVAHEKQITVKAATPQSKRLIRADRLLLYQALGNLLSNAIKYSPEGTSVKIEALESDGFSLFRVEDQGCGVPAEEKNRIFEKFYRRGNKETIDQTGFGLGLAFVREVAFCHGGDVTVESETGKGSTFLLRVPT